MKEVCFIRRLKLLILFIGCLSALSVNAQENYGLAFKSFNVSQENRTSLQIGKDEPLCFSGNMDLSFDFYFIPNRGTYFGYLLRMINNSGQNIDLLYNQKDMVFNTVLGGTFSNINFNIDDKFLYNQWTNIRYHFAANTLSCYLNGALYKTVNISLKDRCFKMLFGANDMHEFATTDVPPMVVRNISIKENDKLKYFWALNNNSSLQGSIEDSVAHKTAFVENPLWSADLHKNWQLLKSIDVKGDASIAYNSDSESLYIVSEDSVFRLPVDDIMSTTYGVASKGYHLFQGNQSLFNTAENKLYNFYIDIKNVAEFANGSFIKSRSYDTVANTEYGHTNRIFVKKENALYVFGGYGQMKYKNEVQRYDFSKKKWEDVVVKGDYFTPRYMAAAGESGSHIYILGGYGSHSGDQLLNPGYLYDLMDFDLATHTFKKLYSLQEPDTSVVFAGSMYIDSANRCYYALCFDKSKYDTRLRLIKGSLVQPKYAFLGNAVPYAFHDVVSDADLFYSPSSRQLIAVTQLVDLGKKTTVKIFGIAFPPCPFVTDVHAKSSFLFYILPIVLILLVLVWLYFLLRKRKHAKLQPAVENKNVVAPLKSPVLAEVEYSNRVLMELTDKASFEPPSFVSERENSVQVFLFGNFEIMNAEGNEMSNLFSPLLKELFLVILLNTLKKGKGVTSEKLNDIFWENKTGKNAKNNLSVNIVRLKGILSKIGQIHIVKNGEHWECEYDSKKVSIDLADFLQLRAVYPDEHGRAYISKMLYFISRGAFLKQTEYGWLDNIKADMNNKIVDDLLEESKSLNPEKDAEYIIEVANCLFNFDPLNEDALHLKCKILDKLGRHSIAKSSYERFIKEYRKSYGEDFPVAFNDILK